jgi:hypothetical protein
MEPHSAVDFAMQQFFREFQLTAVSKLVSPHRENAAYSEKSDSYYLFVDLENAEEADRAITKLHNTLSPWHRGSSGSGAYGSQRITVQRARDNKNRKVFREQNISPVEGN